MSLKITDVDGWTYDGLLPFPANVRGSITNDITQSPPGRARLAVNLGPTVPCQYGLEDPCPYEYKPTNPGRPNGPSLVVSAWGLLFPVSSAIAADKRFAEYLPGFDTANHGMYFGAFSDRCTPISTTLDPSETQNDDPDFIKALKVAYPGYPLFVRCAFPTSLFYTKPEANNYPYSLSATGDTLLIGQEGEESTVLALADALNAEEPPPVLLRTTGYGACSFAVVSPEGRTLVTSKTCGLEDINISPGS